jgi:uncharacterized protein (DUF1697 family)
MPPSREIAFAFIRGINVGGNRKLPMATLRTLCEKLGWTDVATLIQSGNVVFRCDATALKRASADLETAIEKAAGFRPVVVVRTLDELRAASRANPLGSGLDPAKLLVLFLSDEPDAGASKALAAIKADPERIALVQRDVFLHYPNGIGTSKLAFTMIEKAVRAPGTTRNWNTITKVLAMGEALESGSTEGVAPSATASKSSASKKVRASRGASNPARGASKRIGREPGGRA